MKKYKVGDVVWVASFEHTKKTKPCPVCFGELKITLILGNGDQVVLPCDYCGKGYDGPKGYVSDYEYIADAKKEVITAVNITQTAAGEKIEYRSKHYILYPDKILDTEKDAIQRSNELAAEYKKERETQARHIKNNTNKTYSWNAGYHMRAVKQAKHDLEYHEKMATICKQRSKK